MGDEQVAGGILCAGFGTRLRPLTEDLPKPLLPFLNAPLLTYPLERLAAAGVERVGFNLHHLAEAVPPVADRMCRRFGCEPAYAREWEIMGTAGGIRGIWRALEEPDATLMISNGDSLSDVDLGAHLEAHRASQASVTLVVRPRDASQPGKVWVDEAGRLMGLREYRHPEAAGRDVAGRDVAEQDGAHLREFDFTGIHLIEPEVLADIPLEPGCIIDAIYGPMLEAGTEIHASVYEGYWAALDNPRLFMRATRRVLDDPQRFDQAPLEAADAEAEGVFWLDPEGVPEAVEVEPPVFVGHHVEFEGAAEVGPYAVLDGTTIAEGARVRESVVYGTDPVEGTLAGRIAVAEQSVGVEGSDEAPE